MKKQADRGLAAAKTLGVLILAQSLQVHRHCVHTSEPALVYCLLSIPSWKLLHLPLSGRLATSGMYHLLAGKCSAQTTAAILRRILNWISTQAKELQDSKPPSSVHASTQLTVQAAQNRGLYCTVLRRKRLAPNCKQAILGDLYICIQVGALPQKSEGVALKPRR